MCCKDLPLFLVYGCGSPNQSVFKLTMMAVIHASTFARMVSDIGTAYVGSIKDGTASKAFDHVTKPNIHKCNVVPLASSFGSMAPEIACLIEQPANRSRKRVRRAVAVQCYNRLPCSFYHSSLSTVRPTTQRRPTRLTSSAERMWFVATHPIPHGNAQLLVSHTGR